MPDLIEEWRSAGFADDEQELLFEECYRSIAGRPRLVLAQTGQGLDGRIATRTGHSHTINGPPGLDHLHRLRALVDVVVIGCGTAVLDNPRLTTRRVRGPDPVRVVIDPSGRTPREARILTDGEAPTIVITRPGIPVSGLHPSVRHIELAPSADGFGPQRILDALRELGLDRVLIEGGPTTVSRFIDAGCVDELHVMVAPLILGSGRSGFELEPIDRIEQALTLTARSYRLGSDVLFACRLNAAGREGRGGPP